jgi:hypothetical protein
VSPRWLVALTAYMVALTVATIAVLYPLLTNAHRGPNTVRA